MDREMEIDADFLKRCRNCFKEGIYNLDQIGEFTLKGSEQGLTPFSETKKLALPLCALEKCGCEDYIQVVAPKPKRTKSAELNAAPALLEPTA